MYCTETKAIAGDCRAAVIKAQGSLHSALVHLAGNCFYYFSTLAGLIASGSGISATLFKEAVVISMVLDEDSKGS